MFFGVLSKSNSEKVAMKASLTHMVISGRKAYQDKARQIPTLKTDRFGDQRKKSVSKLLVSESLEWIPTTYIKNMLFEEVCWGLMFCLLICLLV